MSSTAGDTISEISAKPGITPLRKQVVEEESFMPCADPVLVIGFVLVSMREWSCRSTDGKPEPSLTDIIFPLRRIFRMRWRRRKPIVGDSSQQNREQIGNSCGEPLGFEPGTEAPNLNGA